MATLDQLSPPQRAIIELVLQRGKTYADLAETLGMPEARVRELAREALVELAPVSARRVDAEWRGQLADYILGQQAGPEATATRGHLRRSEPARGWARSLLDSLEGFYEEGAEPSIPEGERGRRERAPAAQRARRPRRVRAPALTSVQRRRLLAGGGALVVVLLIVLVWPVGVLTGGGGSDSGSSRAGAATNAAACPSGVKSLRRKGPAGLAFVAAQKGRKELIVSASGLQPNVIKNKRPQDAYEVWLYNSRNDARAVGAQVTDRKGRYVGAAVLPDSYKRYACIDVSRQPLNGNQSHSGNSVLRGRLRPFREPPAKVVGNKRVVLEQIPLTPPPQ